LAQRKVPKENSGLKSHHVIYVRERSSLSAGLVLGEDAYDYFSGD
jgi:hypothetical protein